MNMQVRSLQMNRALRSVLLVLLLSAVGMGKMDAQNLIVNSDFESGNTGFFSDYQYMTTGSVDAGHYCIDATSAGHGVGSIGWPTILGYGGSGMYMMVNGFGGTTNPTKVVWKQTVAVTPNTDYIFSCQVVNLAQSVFGYSPNPAILRLKINGSTVGGDYTVAQNNNWHEWSVSWSNGSATQVEIAIYDVYTGDSGLGDDFGLDHLSFVPDAVYSVAAIDDFSSVCYGTSVEIPILDNDIISPGLENTTVQIVSLPFHGEAYYLSSSHKIEYVCLDASFSGTDSFKYRVGFTAQNIWDEAWVYVTVENCNNITFADANVKAICVANWDTNGDGELSYDEAAAVTDLGQVFRGNTTITSFEELQYFTGLATISDYAFYSCSNLSGSLFIPNSVTTIGDYAFMGCQQITGCLTIPNSVTTIGNYAFAFCHLLSGSLTIPNSVITIGEQAFSNCQGFTGSLTIGNSVTTIARFAFIGCNGFTGSLTIPNSVTSIGQDAFYHCSGFTEVYYNAINCADVPLSPFIGCSGLLSIGESVERIPASMFQDCNGFTGSLTIPNSVTSIGYSAFENCTGFSGVIFNATNCADFYKYYIYSPFNGCIGSFTIGESVERIPAYMFKGCNGFTGSLTIPNSVTSIGEDAFKNCSGFTGLIYNATNCADVNYSYSSYSPFNGCVGSLTIGDNVERIPAYMFKGCNGFTGCLTIPNSVTMIGDWAFYDCSGMTSLTISNSVITMGNFAFMNCSGFTGNVTIPDSLTEIGHSVFRDCSGLASLTLPNALTSIGVCAFYGCSSLTSLYIPNSVTSIGEAAFGACSNLEQIIVGLDNVVYDSRENCNGIIRTNTNELVAGCKNTVIPNTVTSLWRAAFEGCINLISIEIPNSVATIGDNAFSGCSGLTSMTVLADNPPTLGNAFYNVDTSITIYVPCNSISAYQSAVGWNEFTNYLPATECDSGVITVTVNPTEGGIVTGAGYYEGGVTCTLTATPNESFSFLNWMENGVIVSNDTVYSFIVSGDRDLVANFGNQYNIEVTVQPVGGGKVCVGDVGDYLYYDNGSYVTSIGTGGGIIYWGSMFPADMINGTTILSKVALYENEYNTDSVTVHIYQGGTTAPSTLLYTQTVAPIGGDAFHEITFASPVTIGPSQNLWVVFSEYGEYPANACEDASHANNRWVSLDGTEWMDLADAGVPGYGWMIRAFLGYQSDSIYAGNYLEGETCTLTAVPNEGWIFGNWTENGTVVSTDSEYSFMVTSHRNLVVQFNDGSNVITFADPNVKAICVANWDLNGDGELSYAEAAAVTDLGQVFRGNTEITSFEELQYFTGLTTISSYAFDNCSNLSGSLYIPNSVTTIGYNAFSGCSGITGGLTIPNAVTTIGNQAFRNCSGFTGNLTIPNAVTTIGNGAFYGCSGFTGSLTIPNSVTSIGGYAFYNCSGFSGDLVIPYSVIWIDYNAFSNCSGFTGSLTIPNSVTEIGYCAFSGCTGFTGSLTIGNSVTTVGGNAFDGCSGFTGSLTIGNSVTMIGYQAFRDCSGFTGSLTIPNSVTTIGDWAFVNCSGFTGSLTIGNSVTTIGNHAFSGCSGFTGDLTIPNSVTSIGDYAFSGCSGFTGNLTIPNSVTTIGCWAFFGCSGLTGSLTIPNSVTTISGYTFYGCSGLTEALLYNSNPPSLGDNALSATIFPIYVLYESLNAYKTATNWSNYESRIFPMSYTTIPGYGEGEGNYRFIASPLVEDTDPTTVDNMITETAYDLYRFDQSEDAEWQNYKAQTESFVLENGNGYLYANADDVNLIFKGEFNEDETKEVELAYDANADFAGWNLVGNPFPVSAYTNRSYYTMNGDGTAVEPNALSSGSAIPACTGIMVMAEAEGETVVFSTEAPDTVPDKGCLQIALSQVVEPVETPTRKQDGPSTLRQAQGSGTLLDKAIVSFNANDRLEKFVFNMDNARISIPQSGKELAIACSDKRGEMPLNFKATKNGQYIISVSYDDVEMDYLHLIDNLTGNDIDLLATSNYTFEAKTTDYASRFRLVFSANETDGPSTGSVIFAYVNKGNIIINGEGALQIVDVTGRVVRCTDVARNVSTNGMVPGVYVLRLINGNDVKTQKIVIE